VPETLTARALNRALLARQGLLQRAAVPALEMVEQLVGMQAQVPENPYVALHARLSTFDPRTLSAPRTRAELATHLQARWPDADPAVLAQAVTYLSPLIQVPPRGLWGGRGQARWALAEHDGTAAEADGLVLRYLRAFGPAGTADIRTWSGLTGLKTVVDRLRPDLRTFADERGAELLDVPSAPLPDPATPAPPRFLPEYDNISLSHADRARILGGRGPGLPLPRGSWIGTLLVDGFYRANWRFDDGTLTIDRFAPASDDPRGTRAAIEAEGERLIGLLAPGTRNGNVEFVG
jgi:DNA glycosylase AlkZ-like